MIKLHETLKIPLNFYIYHVNTNEIYMKRLFKRLKIEKKNILSWNYTNRTNMDVFLWSRERITQSDKDVSNYIIFKDHYQDNNVFLNIFFPGSNFLKKLQEEKSFNSYVYAQFIEGAGAFLITKSEKTKKIVFTNKNDYNRLERIEFQMSMFDDIVKKTEQIERFRNKSIENENKLIELLS